MEPLPEVRAGAERLASLTGIDILESLDALTTRAVSVIPSCVGVSLTVIVDGHPFTVTASSDDSALLDAAQYLDGGPCVETARTGVAAAVPDVLDERRWQTYGQAAAALGVRSSLSLPIWGEEGQTPGAMNFYAADPEAFDDSASALAAEFQVPAEHLVANADLSFMTRQFARELPQRLEAKESIDTAVAVLMQQHGWHAEQSRTWLRTAATRAGTTEDEVATLLLSLHQDPPGE
ncbi:MAG TPA: GAF and ANTAR domain-containing protein [Mycobacteriales bacterium]|jgi:hypothetical protein|nr:GAF and ANTAR domain-containing protein [Mycobacteriales bacterium]